MDGTGRHSGGAGHRLRLKTWPPLPRSRAAARPRSRGRGGAPPPTACEFLLDHDDGPAEDEEAGKKSKRRPYRLRWPDDVRDDVLARLIELNRARAEDERKRGVAVTRRARDARDADADEDADADG